MLQELLHSQRGLGKLSWQNPCLKARDRQDIKSGMVNGKDQMAAAQISPIETLLDQAQEEDIPLVEWALTPIGHCKLTLV